MEKHKPFCFAVLTSILTFSSLEIVNQNAEARSCNQVTGIARLSCDPDPTNPMNRRPIQRIYRTNPNSPAGRIVKKAFPVACGVAGAVATSPATLTAAGILVTASTAADAHKTCYKIVEQVQR